MLYLSIKYSTPLNLQQVKLDSTIQYTENDMFMTDDIQGVTGGTDQTSGGCSLC